MTCYPRRSICMYDLHNGKLAYCEDGTHLGRGKLCQDVVCNQAYKCLLSYCIPTRRVCDDIIDCPNGDDELFCSHMVCPGHMRCTGTKYCVPPWEMCDGIPHCPLHDDEKFCQNCHHM